MRQRARRHQHHQQQPARLDDRPATGCGSPSSSPNCTTACSARC